MGVRAAGGRFRDVDDPIVVSASVGAGGNATAAVQAALDAVPASGGEVILSPGIYVTDELTIARAGTRLTGPGATLRARTSAVDVLLRVIADDVAVDGLRLESGGFGGAFLIRVNTDAAATTAVERFVARALTCICDHRTARGIFVGHHNHARVENCYLENVLALADPAVDVYTAAVTIFSGLDEFSRDTIVSGNSIVGFYDGILSYGVGRRTALIVDRNTIKFTKYRAITTYHSCRTRICSNEVTECGSGIYADSSSTDGSAYGNLLSDNIVRSCTAWGYKTEEYLGASIVGNAAVECQDGLIVGGGTAACSIDGNTFAYNTRYGIWVDKEQTAVTTYVYDLAIVGNIVKGNGEDGMRLGGLGRGSTVSANEVTDNGTTAASAATSVFAGIWIGNDSSAARASGVVLVSNNIIGNNVNNLVGAGFVGKQGFGIFLESTGVTRLIAIGNYFEGIGQYNVKSTYNAVDLLSNVFKDGISSMSNVTPRSNGNLGGGFVTVTQGTAAPTVGTWQRGDIVWNSAPAASGFAGWTCVTAGTPGTWKTFGVISA